MVLFERPLKAEHTNCGFQTERKVFNLTSFKNIDSEHISEMRGDVYLICFPHGQTCTVLKGQGRITVFV